MAQTDTGGASPDDTDRHDKAMRDGLRKDVAAWSAARHTTVERSTDDLAAAVPQRAATTPARRKPAPASPAKPVAKSNKPFSMSYDGVTTAEHIATMVARGAR